MDAALSCAFDPVPGDLDEVNEARRLLGSRMKPVLELLSREGVTELMINQPEDWWVECAGRMVRVDPVLRSEEIEAVVVLLGKLVGRDLGGRSGERCVNVRAGSALRIAAALYPISIEGHSLCIRRHLARRMKLSDFQFVAATEAGTAGLADEAEGWASWLSACVRERRNVLVSGATGSGKTTFANALLDLVPEDERVLSIEDAPELRIRSPNRVRFETRGADDARALLRMALRYRPDRIVVGEVRGEEAYDLLQAWNTGHPGGVSTLHADSAEDALYRLEALVTQSAEVKSWPLSAVRRACAGAVGVVVQLSKHRLREIVVVEGVDESGEYRLRRVFVN
ncbi:type IV secretion system protein PtlH [bacterium BMS3Bbin13]|nr:type IV secretion system protein PtlH [bacterium BMS3Bbin13]